MAFGRPTGGAMPLVSAHAEYLKLVRSAADGQIFDLIPKVADRYRQPRAAPPPELWKFNRQVRTVAAGATVRIRRPRRSACVGAVTSGTSRTTRTAHPPGAAIITRTFASRRHNKLRYDSHFSGPPQGTGKAGISRCWSRAVVGNKLTRPPEAAIAQRRGSAPRGGGRVSTT